MLTSTCSIRSNEGGSSTTQKGTVLFDTTLVVIRWKWAVVHVIFTLATLVLLLVTIMNHRRGIFADAGAWKSSSSAMMLALDPALSRRMGGIGSHLTHGLKQENQLVNLNADKEDGWRLSTKTNLDQRTERPI